MFKEPGSRKVARGLKRKDRKATEDKMMAASRRRDGYCRFPLCGCRKFNIVAHVSHARHRGAGGNPSGDRTTTESTLLVCATRHKENRVAIDRGTLRWLPLDKKLGANGPIVWYVSADAFPAVRGVGETLRFSKTDDFYEVAREREIHVYEPWTAQQLAVLKQLAEMRL